VQFNLIQKEEKIASVLNLFITEIQDFSDKKKILYRTKFN